MANGNSCRNYRANEEYKPTRVGNNIEEWGEGWGCLAGRGAMHWR